MDEGAAPKPVLEIVFGTLIMIVIIFVHGAGIRTINQRFSESWVQVNDTTAYWRLNLLLAITIGSLAALHFAETFLWAIPIFLAGLIPSMRDSYTTSWRAIRRSARAALVCLIDGVWSDPS
nr:hypothetical protein [Mesorhizobium sp.]